MKHLLIVCLIGIFTIPCIAQESHLKFKGIPLDVTLDEFSAQLKQQGFEESTYLFFFDTYSLKGAFAGYNKCHIFPHVIHQSNIVYAVRVIFDFEYTWENLMVQYNDLKSMLQTKYGNPEKGKDFIDDSLSSKIKIEKLIQSSDGVNSLYFNTDNGYIALSISGFSSELLGDLLTCRLDYVDKINQEKFEQAKLEDL